MLESLPTARLRVTILTVVVGASCGGETGEALGDLPSQAIPRMLEELVEHPGEPRDQLMAPFLENLRTTGLDAGEETLLGEAYFIAADPMRAKPYFEAARAARSPFRRLAWQRDILIEQNALGAHETAERLLAEYRTRFAPTTDDLWGLYQPVMSVASRYRDSGDHAEVVRVVLEEARSLASDTPYYSWQLPAMFYDSFVAVGREAVAMELLVAVREKLDGAAANGERADETGPCLRMEDIIALDGPAYRIGDAVRCDLGFRTSHLLDAIEDAVAEIESR